VHIATRKRLRRSRKLLRVVGDRAARGLVNGLALLVDGAAPHADSVPKERVLARGKLALYRYPRPVEEDLALGTEILPGREAETLAVPLLLVPPLMVRPYVYDLRPAHSLVATLVAAGFDLFLVDFGVPDDADRRVNLGTYTLDYLPEVVARVREVTGSPDASLAGYCMGGIFALMYAAATGDPGVRNLVTIGAPIDFHRMGILSWLVQRSYPQVASLTRRIGNIPGVFPQIGLRMTTPLRTLTRWADLFVNLYDDEYVRGFESIHRWVNDFIPYPRDAFQQFFTEILYENKLADGRLSLGDRTADLRTIRSSLLAFAGRTDSVAPLASTRAILDVVGSTDKTFLEVDGGHIGVVAGSTAPAQVWRPMIEWLRPRSL
jgi:polyhydroxyalkanoate synthase